MPARTLTVPAVGYALGCRTLHDGPPPSVHVTTEQSDGAWWASITWPGMVGGFTAAIAGPFVSRRSAILGLREHLQQRRAASRA